MSTRIYEYKNIYIRWGLYVYEWVEDCDDLGVIGFGNVPYDDVEFFYVWGMGIVGVVHG